MWKVLPLGGKNQVTRCGRVVLESKNKGEEKKKNMTLGVIEMKYVFFAATTHRPRSLN